MESRRRAGGRDCDWYVCFSPLHIKFGGSGAGDRDARSVGRRSELSKSGGRLSCLHDGVSKDDGDGDEHRRYGYDFRGENR